MKRIMIVVLLSFTCSHSYSQLFKTDYSSSTMICNNTWSSASFSKYDKVAPHAASLPGYTINSSMMSLVNSSSTIANTTFRCNYYFDAEGQLQDGEITIKRIRK